MSHPPFNDEILRAHYNFLYCRLPLLLILLKRFY